MKITWDRCLEVEHKVQRILVQQEINGIQFDIAKARSLVNNILTEQQDIYNYIRPRLKVEIESSEAKLNKPITFNGVTCDVGHPGFLKSIFLKNGDYSKSVVTWAENVGITLGDSIDVCGPFTRVTYVEPELSKREKLANQLIRLGWKPEIFTETGIPKLTDKGVPVESLENIEGDVGQKLARWFTLGHRLGVVKGWIENVRPDGRLSAYCTGGITNTFRRKHKLIANLPKADGKVVLGKEIRSLFTHKPGTILVGYDAAALEARVMGHYTIPFDGGEFAHELLHGDIHSLNAARFGVTRNEAKTLFYGLIYGAQYRKLMGTFGWSEKKAKRVFNGFWKENIALGRLRDKVLSIGRKYGYLPGIDGRAIQLRGSEHAWLNALFQSCGAIAMNYSLVILDEKCNELGLIRAQCAYYHDEAVDEVPESDVIFIPKYGGENFGMVSKCGKYYSKFGEQAVLSLREAGEQLGLRVPLDSEYQIGHTWAEIH